MLLFDLLRLSVGKGGDGSNFMDTDHLSPTDDIADTIICGNIVPQKPSYAGRLLVAEFDGLCCLRPTDSGIWHEGKLLAKYIFQ